MDTPKPPQKPHHLLDDLESIREFLSNKEPGSSPLTDDFADLPLLTDSVEMGQIPLLSDIVTPSPGAAAPTLTEAIPTLQPLAPEPPAHTPPPAVARPVPQPSAPAPVHAPFAGTTSASIPQPHAAQPAAPQPPAAPSLAQTVQRSVESSNTTSDLLRLDGELRAAAQLILQDVIDDFVPQIEAELKRRLEARLSRLLPPRKI